MAEDHIHMNIKACNTKEIILIGANVRMWILQQIFADILASKVIRLESYKTFFNAQLSWA